MGDIGEFEGAGTVGYEGIGQQHDGCHVLKGDLTSLIGGIEAVGRTLIKKSKTPFLKYNNMNNLNNHKKKIYNNNSNCNSSIFNDHNGTNVSIKVNSSKTINANYMKINSVEKKENKFI